MLVLATGVVASLSKPVSTHRPMEEDGDHEWILTIYQLSCRICGVPRARRVYCFYKVGGGVSKLHPSGVGSVGVYVSRARAH